jgi:preprotein translocase subunit SecD
MNYRRRIAAASLLASAALLVAGCAGSSASPEGSAGAATSGPAATGASAFQIRPVLAVEPAAPGDCEEQPVTPPADQPAAACDAAGPQQSLYDLAPARITLADVAGAEVADSMGAPVVNVALTEAGTAQLAEMTRELASSPAPENMAAIVLDGQVQSAPMVQQEIATGAVQISGFASEAEAQAVVDRLTPQ